MRIHHGSGDSTPAFADWFLELEDLLQRRLGIRSRHRKTSPHHHSQPSRQVSTKAR